MTRNTKIALGCGGAGCLGLVLIIIIGVVLVATGVVKAPGIDNSNRNSNFNSNTNLNSNSDRPSPSSTMSDDDKHKLFQAVHATKDDQLLLRVLARIGFPNGSGEGYDEFLQEHPSWALKNFEFMDTVDTAEKGRAYVEAHIDD